MTLNLNDPRKTRTPLYVRPQFPASPFVDFPNTSMRSAVVEKSRKMRTVSGARLLPDGKKLIQFICTLVVLAVLSHLPARAATAKTAPAPAVTAHVGDAQIESTIRTKLAKSKIGKDGFRFKVARGVVTWEGATPVGQHKGAATRMARTSGATQVINNIEVSGTNKPGTPLKKAYVRE